LTRFANSVIHQNVAEDVTTVRLRLHREGGRRPGSATVVDESGVPALVERASTPSARRSTPLARPRPRRDTRTDRARRSGHGRGHGPDPAQVVRAFVDAAGGLEAVVRSHDHWIGGFVIYWAGPHGRDGRVRDVAIARDEGGRWSATPRVDGRAGRRGAGRRRGREGAGLRRPGRASRPGGTR
jgi:hypothetical protein